MVFLLCVVAVDAARKLDVPAEVIDTMLMARSKGQECAAMAAKLPLAHKMHETGSEMLTPDEDQGDELIHGMPAATFDRHCHEGKRAIAYFRKACPPVRRMLAEAGLDEGEQKEAIGRAIFYAESHVLRPRAITPMTSTVVANAAEAYVGAVGLLPQQVRKLIELVEANGAMLNHARKRVLGLADTGSSPKAVVLNE